MICACRVKTTRVGFKCWTVERHGLSIFPVFEGIRLPISGDTWTRSLHTHRRSREEWAKSAAASGGAWWPAGGASPPGIWWRCCSAPASGACGSPIWSRPSSSIPTRRTASSSMPSAPAAPPTSPRISATKPRSSKVVRKGSFFLSLECNQIFLVFDQKCLYSYV